MNRWWIIGAAVLLSGLALYYYFWTPPLQPLPETDTQVNYWIQQFDKTNAIEFLENGGLFMNARVRDGKLDEEVVLPLLKRIKEETGIEPLASLMPDSNKIAGMMLVNLPADPAKLERLKQIFVEADDAYEGPILRNYGDLWMHFELMDPTLAKMNNMSNWDSVE